MKVKSFWSFNKKISFLGSRQYSVFKNPFTKTYNVLTNDVPNIFGKSERTIYPEHADVVIIGGGFLGSSIAYWLKTRTGRGLNVVVLEKDLKYKQASKISSVGEIHQHYSLPENILLSQYSVEFLQNAKENFNIDTDIEFFPHGCLYLATEQNAEKLEENVTTQRELGVRNELLTPNKIKERYPWINCDDIKVGCIAKEGEGWFQPCSFLEGFSKRARELGAIYVNAEVTGFETVKQHDVLMEGLGPGEYERLTKLNYKSMDGDEYTMKFSICVLAAGVNSQEMATLAQIGSGKDLLSLQLPIEKRNNTVCSFMSSNINNPGINTPIIMDTSRTWIRKIGLGKNFLCGQPHWVNNITSSLNADISEYYKKNVLPTVSHRVPSLENTEIENSWTEVFDHNTYDDTGIIGPHPYHNNLFLACGFNTLGIQHAPGIGRALTELIIDSRYVSIDLTRFSFDRLLTDYPMVELNVY